MPEAAAPVTKAPGVTKQNKRIITIAVVVVVLIVAVVLIYKYWYKPNYIDNKKEGDADNVKQMEPSSEGRPMKQAA